MDGTAEHGHERLNDEVGRRLIELDPASSSAYQILIQ